MTRIVVATVVVGGYMAIGFALGLSADAYLLLGIPITVAFQLLVVRRPLRSLWLRSAPPLRFGWRSIAAVVLLAIAPAVVVARGLASGDIVLVGWGTAAMVGAFGAVYSMRSASREMVESTIRATVITSTILVTTMIVFRVATGGFRGNVAEALATTVVAVVTYLPAVFVLEEVFFRGLLDTYLHGSAAEPDHPTALYGSALWGIWHLPVAFITLGAFTIPYLVLIHTVLGYFLIASWRRTGNLAAPGIAHAVSDALRNGVAVL